MKTIALAIQRIGADSQDPHTIHLANGRYAEDQHFPLNLRNYVSIIGESEEGVIFGGPDVFFLGWDSEKEVTIKNITFTATTKLVSRVLSRKFFCLVESPEMLRLNILARLTDILLLGVLNLDSLD